MRWHGFMVRIVGKHGTVSHRFCDTDGEALAMVARWRNSGYSANYWEL